MPQTMEMLSYIQWRYQFSVPQIEYPLGGSSKKGSHVYFLLIVFMVSDCTIVTLAQHLYQTIVQFDKTILLPRKPSTGSIHDYLFCYCPLVGILFEVLRIQKISCEIVILITI